MKISFSSDGSITGTKVTDENGNPVHGVTELKFHHKAGEVPMIDLCLHPGASLGLGDAFVRLVPNGKAVKSITYEDGTVVEY
jgi:hypothetical protein